MVDELATFYLGDWYVDTRANRLVKHAQEIKIESKVMAVLHYLARHQGELVTREMLEQAVWGKTVVGYDALTGCIARLRKVLEDDPRQPRFIETVSKKGYRLISEITLAAPPVHNNTATTTSRFLHPPWLWRAGIGLVVLGLVFAVLLTRQANHPATSVLRDRPSLVVLPFTNMSNEPGHDYFSDGMTADITTALSKLSGLLVIAQSSASSWQDTPATLPDIARSLGVQYVLQGNVQRQGNTLRVNVHLIDAERDIYLWSEQYDRELHNVFAVQDDITMHIVQALSVKLTQEEKRRTAQRYTHSVAAYDDFLRGQAVYGRHTREDNHLARDFYQQAIDRDGEFARAYSAMALTYVADYRFGWAASASGQLDHALKLARYAVDVDKELPQALWVLAYVHVFRQEYDEAATAASRAIELEPNFADSYITLAVCKMHFGAPAEALHLVRKAMLRNPRYPAAYASVLGQIYYFLGDYDQAVPALRDAIDRNSNLLTPHVFLIVALSKLDRQEEAVWVAEQVKTLAADFSVDQVAGLLPIHDAKIIKDMQQHLRRIGLK